MSEALRIGVAGLGTVGVGLIGLLRQNARVIAARAGRDIRITAVSARDRSRDRGVSLEGLAWESDPVALASRDDVDLVVELIGGEDGPAKALVEAALANGKHVVTANKALLAYHGQALANQAEQAGLGLRFEAAVAGAVPVIKTMTESLAGNQVTRVSGVLNGTCNYILTRMESAQLPYSEVFEEARALGYLEADPTLDVGGIDAAHKIALLAAIGFGAKVKFEDVAITGIEKVSIEDIHYAESLGLRIKLIGSAQLGGRGLTVSVAPALVPRLSPLGQLEGATNMVVVDSDAAERVVLSGPGAGAGPTASAVLGDIIDIARGITLPPFGQPLAEMQEYPASTAAPSAPWYIRLSLVDKPGALARIATALSDAGISIDRMRQTEHDQTVAPVLIVTHKTAETALKQALSEISESGVIQGEPVALRIEQG